MVMDLLVFDQVQWNNVTCKASSVTNNGKMGKVMLVTNANNQNGWQVFGTDPS
jgi:hypothetical protein